MHFELEKSCDNKFSVVVVTLFGTFMITGVTKNWEVGIRSILESGQCRYFRSVLVFFSVITKVGISIGVGILN